MSHLRVPPSKLHDLQYNTSHIRNICIIAHIDHGKTTLADNILSSNGIISQKMAGKLRYLDSTDDEQKRGITMYSSAISLLYSMEPMNSLVRLSQSADTTKETEEYLINLVDSPGHIDFSSDVSTATRLCDGALLVVDVLEGICPQTHAVLYKALKDRMHPCLILNKLDKLILELQLSPFEAFQHLRRIIEQVNALASTLLNSELRSNGVYDNEKEDPLVEIWNFAPEKGNVVFASAIDGWGFGLGRFAIYWARQLSLNKNVVQKHMFDDFAFNKSTKKIVKVEPGNPNSKPMFVTMVLEPIWQMYNVVMTHQNCEKAAKMAKKLGFEIAKRDIFQGTNKTSSTISGSSGNLEGFRSTLQAIMRSWLPLADAVLRTVVRTVPDPAKAQNSKSKMFFPDVNSTVPSGGGSEKVLSSINKVSNDVASCRHNSPSEVASTDPDPSIIVFIAKMIPIRIGDLAPADIEKALQALQRTNNDDGKVNGDYGCLADNVNNIEVFLALGRVFSGTLSADSEASVYILGHHHDPFEYTKGQNGGGTAESTLISANPIPLSSLSYYMCLGPSVLPVSSVPAGNIVCMFGLQDFVLKSGTLSSTPYCLPMKSITFQSKPMLRVAVEPKNHYNLRDLERGLEQLFQYDPVVEIGVDDLGQSTITCLGELHLELCLKALSEKFAKCEVKSSPPLVPFRETVISSPLRKHSCIVSTTHAPGYDLTLPPPWNDVPGINHVHPLPSSLCASGGCQEASLGCGAFHRLVMSSQLVAITFRCFALPSGVTNFLSPPGEDSSSPKAKLLSDMLSLLNAGKDLDENSESRHMRSVWNEISEILQEHKDQMEDSVDVCLFDQIDLQANLELSDSKDTLRYQSLLRRLISLGPHGVGPNLLLFSPSVQLELYENMVPKEEEDETEGDDERETDGAQLDQCVESKLLAQFSLKSPQDESSSLGKKDIFRHIWSRLRGSVISGFQMLSSSGPLMQEPLRGVCFSVEKVEVSAKIAGLGKDDMKSLVDDAFNFDCSSQTMLSTGQLISDVRDSLRLSMLGCSLRLVEPIYKCSLQCDQTQLGNLYGVLSRRRGEVVDEDVIEGTSLFILSVCLPIANSFGFAQELLHKTSGSGTAPQLFFSHWSINEVDPFWKPKTTEEQEEHGTDGGAEHNLARTYIDSVRRRKGLVVEQKMVVFAEKQRTLTRNK